MKKENEIQKPDEVLREMLSGKFENFTYKRVDDAQDETNKLIIELCNMLSELNEYTSQLSKGNLSAKPPARKNFLAMGVKNLHAQLNHLTWQLNQVAKGDYDQVIDYMGDLSDGFNWMAKQLRARKERIEYELDHDVLTGLLNRKAFMRKAYDLIAGQPEKTGALLFCDLDNLKYVNDTFGHEAGDRYIMAAAEMFGLFHKINGLVARISGDEFAIYLHGYTTSKEIMNTVLSFIDQNFDRSIVVSEQKLQRIRSSNGISLYPDDATTISELIKYADYAMYEVKKTNKGVTLPFNNASY